jgi:hypothetical protein
MKFTLKKTPNRIFWAEIHHLEMETEDKRRVLCVLQTKSRRKGMLMFAWRTSYSFKYYWKDTQELIEDMNIIEALDEIFHANLIKEFDNGAKGRIYDSEEESKIFKC